MHRALALLLVLLVAVRPDAVLAQTPKAVVITINSDGTCRAVDVHARCREIGSKLREAGIPLDTPITFTGATTINLDVTMATVHSVAKAGFWNSKIGFLTEPVR